VRGERPKLGENIAILSWLNLTFGQGSPSIGLSPSPNLAGEGRKAFSPSPNLAGEGSKA